MPTLPFSTIWNHQSIRCSDMNAAPTAIRSPKGCSRSNCKTSADGLIHELNVTIYNSIELMSADLFEDLRLHERRGTFKAKREHVQIMNDFNCGL